MPIKAQVQYHATSLLQLANLYAVFPPRRGQERELSDEAACPLPDRIGLCYIHRNRALLSDEVGEFSSGRQARMKERNLCTLMWNPTYGTAPVACIRWMGAAGGG
ncbi:hypothetical protein Taro_030342 [Colocasia esculenta]|uniref:Uncharacterized protein n=1 Tax=Colocasia esculenta TaxID=4460 RepID=A0A843VRP0_COLES|nr:hypothetical protein [Colocasia esculenta]